jgi:hypothetical protein
MSVEKYVPSKRVIRWLGLDLIDDMPDSLKEEAAQFMDDEVGRMYSMFRTCLSGALEEFADEFKRKHKLKS